MTRFPILSLAWRSIANRRGTALLTILTVAIAMTLFLGVEKCATVPARALRTRSQVRI